MIENERNGVNEFQLQILKLSENGFTAIIGKIKKTFQFVPKSRLFMLKHITFVELRHE